MEPEKRTDKLDTLTETVDNSTGALTPEEQSVIAKFRAGKSAQASPKRFPKNLLVMVGVAMVVIAVLAIAIGASISKKTNPTNNSLAFVGNKPTAGETLPTTIETKPSVVIAETSAQTTAQTTETEAKSEGIPTVESLQIDASELSNPDALVKKWIALTTDWYNAGATPENAHTAIHTTNITVLDYATKLAAEYDKVYIEALLGKDWQTNPEFVNRIGKLTTIHRENLTLYFRTYDSMPIDKEAYRRELNYVKTVSTVNNGDGSVTVTTIEHGSDNSEYNRVGESLTSGVSIDTSDFTTSRTFRVENGKVVMSGSFK